MNDNTLQRLCQEVATILNAEQVDPDAPLGQLGIDSLNVVELILVTQSIYTNVADYEEYDFNGDSTLRNIDAHMRSCCNA